MFLKHVSISNFRSIKELEFEFPESNLLVLVGPNNAGKSNIIRAIDLICGESWTAADKLDDFDYYLRDRHKTITIELSFNNGSSCVFDSKEKWARYLNAQGHKIFSSVKEDFPCTYLGADRTIDKHLSFYDYSLIGRIRKKFHQKAKNVETQLQMKFEELVKIFDEVEGFQKFKDDFARFFDEMQADTPAKLSIDFQPFTPSNYFKTIQILATDPQQSNEPVDLLELGEGSRNTVLLALLRSYALNLRSPSDQEGGILALEEPEIFLHPQARRHLLKILRQLADEGIQVIISTHSSSFVDTELFHSIGQVFKVPDDDNATRRHSQLCLVSKKQLVEHCLATGVPAGKATEANIGEFYRTTSNYRLSEAFFARFIVLVEGETEELALPEYFSALGIDCDLQGISIIAVNGKNQIPKYWRLFSQFNTPLAVMFDDDDDGGSKGKSNLNLSSCFGLSVDDITAAADSYNVVTSTNLPETSLFILRKDFENALKFDFCQNYNDGEKYLAEVEKRAVELIQPLKNQNKGQIARYVARRIIEDCPGYVPAFVEALASEIQGRLGVSWFVPRQPETDSADFAFSEEDCPF